MAENIVHRAGNITTQFRQLHPQQSNFPYIFRDGGGGGTVSGLDLIIFADGMYTNGPPPTNGGNIVGFTSNSIGLLGVNQDRATTIEIVTDVGTTEKGPKEAIPFFTNDGEAPMNTGVWPNQNIAAIQSGQRGVTFPEVIDRRLFKDGKDPLLYNTAVEMHIQQGRPVVARPYKSLFVNGEPMFGSFVALSGPRQEGYIYLFARVSEKSPKSNGLKLARVLEHLWADRSQYEYWNGQQFEARMPALDDGGISNVFHYSQEAFGKHYGPGSGDIFWSHVYNEYILLFQNAAAAFDSSVYMAHSPNLTGGWSEATCIFKMPRAPDGYSYAFHSYANMDPSGKKVPVTWTQDSKINSCFIGTGELLFS